MGYEHIFNDTLNYHNEHSNLSRLHITQNYREQIELIKNPLNLEYKDFDGKTPLSFKLSEGDYLSALIYLEAGADVNTQDDYGNTPLHWVGGNVQIAYRLVGKGAKIMALNNYNQTPLHTCQSASVAEYLIELGADVNAEDKEGQTPLYLPCYANHIEILIENGANIDHKDNKGRTALMKSASMARVESFSKLLDYDADYTILDNYGRNVEFYISSYRGDELKEILKSHIEKKHLEQAVFREHTKTTQRKI